MKLHYDLHSHSTASDGSLTPTELVELAVSKGVDVLALTDHDTTQGLDEAEAAAQRHEIRLIPGIEISVTWNRRTIHVVGLNIDRENAELSRGVADLQQYRDWRAREIARKLEKSGISDAFDGAKKYSSGKLIGRTHFAKYLVEIGKAKNIREVFKRYLVNNKPGHVSGDWATMEQAVSWIKGAGGQAIIAHPARYRLSATKLRELITDFKAAGGVGIEVISGSHSRHEQEEMFGYAHRHELYASCGSDFHGPENSWLELGKLLQIPEHANPIWKLWEESLVG